MVWLVGGEGEDLPVREGLNFVSVGCTVLSVCPGALVRGVRL